MSLNSYLLSNEKLSESFRASATSITNLYKTSIDSLPQNQNGLVISNAFTCAASSVTQLYKDASELVQTARLEGYKECLLDLCQALQIQKSFVFSLIEKAEAKNHCQVDLQKESQYMPNQQNQTSDQNIDFLAGFFLKSKSKLGSSFSDILASLPDQSNQPALYCQNSNICYNTQPKRNIQERSFLFDKNNHTQNNQDFMNSGNIKNQNTLKLNNNFGIKKHTKPDGENIQCLRSPNSPESKNSIQYPQNTTSNYQFSDFIDPISPPPFKRLH
ncbi:hypothetical protein BB560_003809 [Smittium megazygosporum]|uniref:Uncharacterized protein n=1 Tax=Smittium megazygosporum TaxID=133381 RepID=A0A2T9ZAZ8_9FUNG|nr:hypothetical protein BB560_003809 [Smittium megazygosporum]